MTQEDKELLLKDLCARLPYKPIVQIDDCGIWNLRGVDHDDSAELRDRVIVWHGENYPSSKNSFPIINCKPYLFPLSSMTEEQKQEYTYIVNYISPDDTDTWKEGEFIYVEQFTKLYNMKTDNIVILNREHPDFKRLYWNTDKEKIKHILSRVNVKYLRGLIRQFIIPDNDWDTIAGKDLRLFIRYDGYQFTVSEKTVIKELYRRGV